MQDTTHPTALKSIDLLTGYVARSRVGVRYNEIADAAAQFGYSFRHEHGNVYGRIKLEPISNTPTPVLRLIARSDHAAVTGSRRAA